MALPIIFLILGVLCGKFILPGGVAENIDPAITAALCTLVFCSGIDIGSKRIIFQKLREYRMKVLLFPFAVIVSSVLSGVVLGWFLGMPANESGAVAAGLGYYSLSSGILTRLGGIEIGSLAFLSNVLREMASLLLIPFIAKHVSFHAAVAAPGAASMDTALGLISRCTDSETALLSMINGVVLTLAMPVLVPLIYQMFFIR